MAGLNATGKNLAALEDGVLSLPIRRLRQRQKPPWLTFEISDDIPRVATNGMARSQLQQDQEETPPPLALLCQRCHHQRHLSNLAPLNKGTWITLQCKSCLTASRINRWLCSCGKPWHTCPQHATIGFKQRRKTKATPTTTQQPQCTTAHRDHDAQPLGIKNVTRNRPTSANTTASSSNHVSTNLTRKQPLQEGAPASTKRPKVPSAAKGGKLGQSEGRQVTRKRVFSQEAFLSQTERMVQAFARRRLEQEVNTRVDGGFVPQGDGAGGEPLPINLTITSEIRP